MSKDRDSRGRLKKGHAGLGNAKVIKMCKRCNEHGISIGNHSGLCGACSNEIRDAYPLGFVRRKMTIFPLQRRKK